VLLFGHTLFVIDLHIGRFSKDKPIEVPTGYSEFPKEIFSPPLSLAEQYYHNIVFWQSHKHGGHFAAMENPYELASDINKFVKKII
jgi:hypothetical protein